MKRISVNNRPDIRVLKNPKLNNAKVKLVEDICDFVKTNPESRLSLPALERKFGVSRFQIQKSFKEVMGISPRKYVEEFRIDLLKENLKKGESIPKAVYRTGYNSQSWLYGSPLSKLGMSRSNYRNGGDGLTIKYLTSKCKLGYLIVAMTEIGVCSVSIADSEELLISHLRDEYPRANIKRSNSAMKNLKEVLNYFEGQLLKLPVEIKGTEFQRKVWSAIIEIPYGDTKSYNEIAEKVGNPRAYRAVANACARNPVPLIIPCHRVIRKNGDLGGYGLGIKRKEFLLKMEKANRKKI